MGIPCLDPFLLAREVSHWLDQYTDPLFLGGISAVKYSILHEVCPNERSIYQCELFILLGSQMMYYNVYIGFMYVLCH